jgi:CheY-like chemotaxis protein
MVVDNEPAMRAAVRKICVHLGHTVVFEAESGNKALALFIEHLDAVDLVLTDREMPNGDGIQLIRDIKKISSLTPIIVMSGGMMESDATTAFEAGASAVLPKPFSMAALSQMIQDVCGDKP